MKESDVEMVCRVLAHDFKITKENSLDSKEIVIDPSTIPQRTAGDEPRPITHTYTSPANTFYITSMAKSSIEAHALSVIGKLPETMYLVSITPRSLIFPYFSKYNFQILITRYTLY